MRRFWASSWYALVALLSVAAAIVAPTSVQSEFGLTATALYMGGTGHPLSIPEDTTAYVTRYVDFAYTDMVGPSGLCHGGDSGCAQVALRTPAEFWPFPGLRSLRFDESVAVGVVNLDDCLRGNSCTVTDQPFVSTGHRRLTDTTYTVFGYSQSGTISSIQKSELIARPSTARVSFVFNSNPNRPNGGILQRFVGAYIPILGVTFNGATATDSPRSAPLTTVDFIHQYDPIGDFPTNPLNLLSLVNSLPGFLYQHPEGEHGEAELQGQYQDTTYYLFPTVTLPLLAPLMVVPYVGPLIATMLDPPLRVLVETGYDRTINPGAPTPAHYLYFPDPVQVAVNFLVAIPTGWDNGIAYITGDPTNRPFHTIPQGPYGVGGPPVYAGAVDPYGPAVPALGLLPANAVARTGPAAETVATGIPDEPRLGGSFRNESRARAEHEGRSGSGSSLATVVTRQHSRVNAAPAARLSRQPMPSRRATSAPPCSAMNPGSPHTTS